LLSHVVDKMDKAKLDRQSSKRSIQRFLMLAIVCSLWIAR